MLLTIKIMMGELNRRTIVYLCYGQGWRLVGLQELIVSRVKKNCPLCTYVHKITKKF